MRYAMFRMAVVCQGCGARVTADRPAQRLACSRCSRPTELPQAGWNELIGRAARALDALEPGQGHQGTQIGGRAVDWVYGRKEPRCTDCGEPLPLTPEATEPPARCNACGKEQRWIAPPAWLSAGPTARVRAVLPAPNDAAPEMWLALDPAEAPAEAPERTAPSPRPDATTQMPTRAHGATRTGAAGLLTGRRPQLLALLAALIVVGAVIGARWMRPQQEEAPAALPPKPAPAPQPERRAQLSWRASVLHAEGWPLTTGSACVAALDVTSDGDKLQSAALDIRCGNSELHGMQAREPKLECLLFEGPAFDAKSHEYDAACKRHAPGAERAQLRFDTRRRRAILESLDPAYRVELELVREDGELEGPSLFRASDEGKPSFEEVTRRAGVVERLRGETRIEAGARCELAVAPTPLPEMPCRVRLRCGGVLLYGGFGQGFTHCVVVDGQPTLALDDGATAQDGDPRLRADVAESRVVVSDALPDREVRIALDP